MGDAKLILVNLAGTEEGIPDLSAANQLPILQDDVETHLAQCFGASKWYIYIIDKDGVPQTIFYSLNLDSEVDRLLSAIAAVQVSK
jgi:hypothetical protein